MVCSFIFKFLQAEARRVEARELDALGRADSVPLSLAVALHPEAGGRAATFEWGGGGQCRGAELSPALGPFPPIQPQATQMYPTLGHLTERKPPGWVDFSRLSTAVLSAQPAAARAMTRADCPIYGATRPAPRAMQPGVGDWLKIRSEDRARPPASYYGWLDS